MPKRPTLFKQYRLKEKVIESSPMHMREAIAASNTRLGGKQFLIEITFNASNARKYFMTHHCFMQITSCLLN